MQNKYKPDTQLQARQWKVSGKAAYETVQKNWCALAVSLKPLIKKHKNIWTDTEIHYAYWLVYSEKRLAETICGKAPLPDTFNVSYAEQKCVRNYLRRVVRRKRGSRPVAKTSRSFELDANMYDVIEKVSADNKKIQLLSIMSLTPRNRIIIPLSGWTTIRGNIKIVLDFERHRVEVHVGFAMRLPKIKEDAPVIGLDAGTSEVFADDIGNRYEPTFGNTLKTISEQLNKTGKRRNRLYATRDLSGKHKSRRITKFNLGRKKLNLRKRNGKIRVQQQISHAIHEVCETRHPSTIITERLDIRGKAKSKGMSRLVSYWMRGSLKERLGFLALVVSYHHKQVKPAYTSQMCPTCLFVHKDNRKCDTFKCLNCGHRDYADRVAAQNLITRYYDPDITLYTPKAVVKSILLGRFNDSLEKCGHGRHADTFTVSVRTDDNLHAPSERNAAPPIMHQNRDGTEMSYFSTF
ncbi:MAG: zinc ribbon domain-containing protein [Methylobacter sp.]|nr:zinc ribbon domain-containing protein [Methylobacter sp.]